ncbi:hypothetical protein [Acinetobacter guillouiae]|uniref:hypothetical protein n=1 Tax=Acinetobacter guillouiae TaxID=106649 RepID=UPI00333F53B2
MSNLLINEHPLMFSPTLAIELGSTEAAVFMQQLHFWLGISQHKHDGKTWVFNNIDQCIEMVRGTIKKRTLERIISDLKKRNLITVAQLNKNKWKKTNYFTINYVELENLGSKYSSNQRGTDTAKMAESKSPQWRIPYCQNGGIEVAKVAGSLQKITTEEYFQILNTILKKSKSKTKVLSIEILFDEFWKTVPNKDGRKVAFAAFKKAIKKIGIDELILAYKANVQVCDSQNRFKKNPATWLNQECWNDESIQAVLNELKNPRATQQQSYKQESIEDSFVEF